MRCADAHQMPAGGALAVDREGFAEAVEAALASASADHDRARRSRGLAARDWDSVDRRHRAADLARAGRGDPRADRRGRARLLRRHRADRARETIDMGVAWRQSRYDKAGPGGTGADYINCPMSRDQYESLRRRAAGGGEDRVPRIRGHALFRRLPADRGDGRARPRDAAPRADEAGRPHQRARAGRQALRGRAAAAGQCARHAVQHGRLPDQAETRRAGARLPHDPGPANAPNSRGSAACTATPSSTRRACSTPACA